MKILLLCFFFQNSFGDASGDLSLLHIAPTHHLQERNKIAKVFQDSCMNVVK